MNKKKQFTSSYALNSIVFFNEIITYYIMSEEKSEYPLENNYQIL
jgi:hypothetical protein